MLAGLNVAVTPFGKPVADKLTAPLNPFRFTVIVLVTLLPRPTLKSTWVRRQAEIGAGAEALTVSRRWYASDRIPVTVRVTVPTVATLLAANVNVLFPVVGFGLNPADTPLGKAEVTARPTLPLNPFAGVTVIVVFPPTPPCTVVNEFGEALRLKSGAGGAALTVRLTDVV